MNGKPKGKYVDWEITNKEVLQATLETYKGRNFVPSKSVARHITANRARYPQFKDIPETSVLLRTTAAMKKMNWRVWGSSGKRGTVFVAPWAERR